MTNVDLQAFLPGYLAEVEEHLRATGQNLLAVEQALAAHQTNARAVREAFRSLHTIKGLSAMVGVEPVVELAHAMESVLRAADRAGGRLDRRAVDRLVEGLRAIETRVAALAEGRAVAAAPAAIVDALAGLPVDEGGGGRRVAAVRLPAEMADKLAPAERQQLDDVIARGWRVVRLDFVPTPERAAAGLNITAVRERLGRVGEIIKVVPLSVPRDERAPGGLAFALLVGSEADDAALAGAADADPGAVVTVHEGWRADEQDVEEEHPSELGRRRVVRVDVARLDDALDKLSSLVVTRFKLERALARLQGQGADVRELAAAVAESGRQLRDLRAAIMRARMVSVAELLDRVPLIVRGLARAAGKAVRVDIDAGRAELDKAVGERLLPAIVHLVNNAIDHGIEPPEVRARKGKPPEGTIRVRCHERSNSQLELSVSDDGGGIDRARVAERAGRPAPESDEALLGLLTIPGMSTRETATTTSGRGLGMDIVQRLAVDQLGGELLLRTSEEAGTTFTLRVPLTITIVDAFSFRCGGQTFVVPVALVEEIVELDRGRLRRPPVVAPGRAPVALYERRGEALPIVDLDAWLDLPRPKGERAKAIVVRRSGQPFGFAVERMLGQQEIVVRPIADPLVRAPGFTGSTDLGDGRPTLVVDLVALAGNVFVERAAS